MKTWNILMNNNVIYDHDKYEPLCIIIISANDVWINTFFVVVENNGNEKSINFGIIMLLLH